MDRQINAKVPSFIMQSYLILHGILLWVQGFAFFAGGVFLHIVLKNLFVDAYGLEETGVFCYYLCFIGLALMGVSFLTNFILFNPSILSYGALSFVYALLYIFQVLFCLSGFHYLDKVKNVLRLAISTVMANYNADHYVNVMLNTLQSMLRCCGSTSYASWFLTGWADGKPRVPESCCRSLTICHNLEPVIGEDINKIGCNVRIDAMATTANAVFLGVLLTATITEFCAISATLIMLLRYRKLRELNSVQPIVERSATSSQQ